MKIIVYVTPKKNVLDPQGAAVRSVAMASLGFPAAKNVRVGKTIEFEMEGEDTPAFRAALARLSTDLLSNPIIEDYRFETVPDPAAKRK